MSKFLRALSFRGEVYEICGLIALAVIAVDFFWPLSVLH